VFSKGICQKFQFCGALTIEIENKKATSVVDQKCSRFWQCVENNLAHFVDCKMITFAMKEKLFYSQP